MPTTVYTASSLRAHLRTVSSTESVEFVSPFETLGSLSSDTETGATVYAFAAADTWCLLRTQSTPSSPCPRCVLYHLATTADELSRPANASVKTATEGKQSTVTADGLSSRLVTELDWLLAFVKDAPDPSLGLLSASGPEHTSNVFAHPTCPHARPTLGPSDDAISVVSGSTTKASLSTPAASESESREGLFTSSAQLAYAPFDRRVGLIRSVRKLSSTALEWPRTFPALAVTVATIPHPGFPRFPTRLPAYTFAAGSDSTSDLSLRRAFAEAMERIAVLALPPDTPRQTEAQVDSPLFIPTDTYHHSDEQYSSPEFPFNAYDQTRSYRWTPCVRLATGAGDESQDSVLCNCGDEPLRFSSAESVAVHNDLLYTTPFDEVTPSTLGVTTSGCAAHRTIVDACRRAVCELFERDATQRHWYTQAPQPHIDSTTLPMPERGWVDALKTVYDVQLIDATRHESFPVVEVVARYPAGGSDPIPGPTFVATSGCGLTARRALRRALREALATVVEVDAFGAPEPPSLADIETPADHRAFYDDPGRQSLLDAFLTPTERRSFAAVATNRGCPTRSLSDAAAATDADILVRSLAPPVVQHLGVYVVRAVSPDLLGVTFGYDTARLNHPKDPIDDRSPDAPHPFT